VTYSYGLHKKCSTVTGTCQPFPSAVDCEGDAQFCALWRTVGFLMNFAVIFEFATFIAFVVVLLGGVQQRSYGWKMVCSLLALVAVVQAVGMSIIVSAKIMDLVIECRLTLLSLGVRFRP
jgi:hypothetical protein